MDRLFCSACGWPLPKGEEYPTVEINGIEVIVCQKCSANCTEGSFTLHKLAKNVIFGKMCIKEEEKDDGTTV